jgi:hypothetical protein
LLRKRKDFLLYLSTEIVCVFCLCLNSWIFLCLQFLQDLLASSAACCTEGAWGCQEESSLSVWNMALCILSLPIVLLLCCCAWWSLVPAAPNKTMCVVRCVAFCYQIWLREVEDSARGLKLPWNPHTIASLVLYR